LVIPNNEVKEKVFSILTQHLIYQEKPKKTLTDKIADFFLSLLPEEEEETITPKDAPVASESLRPA